MDPALTRVPTGPCPADREPGEGGVEAPCSCSHTEVWEVSLEPQLEPRKYVPISVAWGLTCDCRHLRTGRVESCSP